MRSPSLFVAILLLAVGAPAARAQVSPISTLWREWAVIEAEWRTERESHPGERQRHRSIRAAVSEGRDPRMQPAPRLPRPAGPGSREAR